MSPEIHCTACLDHQRRYEELTERIKAVVRLLYPDDMTPNGKHIFDSILGEQ